MQLVLNVVTGEEMPYIQCKVGNEGGNLNSTANEKMLNKMAEICSNVRMNVNEFKTPIKTDFGFLKISYRCQYLLATDTLEIKAKEISETKILSFIIASYRYMTYHVPGTVLSTSQ